MAILEFLPVIVIVGFLVFSCIKILNEYERGVVFRLGKFHSVRGPGLILLIPGVEKMIKVDMRIVTMDVPSQDIITKDNITLKVNGVIYFRVDNPMSAINTIENFYQATAEISQTTLRSVTGQYELDEMLASREEINSKLQLILDEVTHPWGIKVTNVELKAIDLPEDMQRVMARKAEAERDRRAKIISAEGELLASQKLSEAANILAQNKDAITLRYLDTMKEMSTNKGAHTIFFPLPVDFLTNILAPKKD
jgi:regulator of protease activity HflC (stomatin/prohibitin superfamily)